MLGMVDIGIRDCSLRLRHGTLVICGPVVLVTTENRGWVTLEPKVTDNCEITPYTLERHREYRQPNQRKHHQRNYDKQDSAAEPYLGYTKLSGRSSSPKIPAHAPDITGASKE